MSRPNSKAKLYRRPPAGAPSGPARVPGIPSDGECKDRRLQRELAVFRSKAQNLESLERKARAVGQIQDEHARLVAAVELLTDVLELSERLIGLAWMIRAEAGLKTRPE